MSRGVDEATAAAGRMNIGEVHARLKEEFPQLQMSKLRYFEAEGLVVKAYGDASGTGYSVHLPADAPAGCVHQQASPASRAAQPIPE